MEYTELYIVTLTPGVAIMTADPAALSRTDRNLWNAILSEAMANLKYNAYAHKALEEGCPEVAQVFQEVAGAETIHGINHLRVSGALGSTRDNLQQVIAGEAKEFSARYPRMIREAQAEGREDAAASFALAFAREQHHLEAFAQALQQLETRAPASIPAATAALAPEPPPTIAPATEIATGPAAAPVNSPDGLDLETYIAAGREVDRERFRVANLGRLREVVFGAQDGILSTVALATSVAVAVGDGSTVLLAGLAAALSGMISMAAGAYMGSRAEQDVQQAEIAREARELSENPAEELAELVIIFQREGKTYAEAVALADAIAQDKDLWLRTLVEKELGISPEDTTHPLRDALVMGLSFITAALVPIFPYLFLQGGAAIAVSVTAALIALFILGMGKGRLVSKSPLLQGLEILTIGALSAGLGFLLGDLIPRLLT